MNIPEYLFCENKSALPGAGLILYTCPPFWVGQVIKCASRAEMDNFIRKHNIATYAHPFDYTILVAGCGKLGEYPVDFMLLPAQEQADAIAKIYRQMADFYLTEKIHPNERYYARYRDAR